MKAHTSLPAHKLHRFLITRRLLPETQRNKSPHARLQIRYSENVIGDSGVKDFICFDFAVDPVDIFFMS